MTSILRGKMFAKTKSSVFFCLIYLCSISTGLADDVGRLRIEVEALETQLLELTEPQLGLPAEEIRKQVESVFRAKQRLAETQLQMLADRVKYMESEIQRRSSNAEQIVQRRVTELLDRRAARSREQKKSSNESADQLHGSIPLTPNESAHTESSEQGQGPTAKEGDAAATTFVVYYLRHVEAEWAYEALSHLLAGEEHFGVRLAYDTPTNNILLQGRKKTHKLVQELLEQLDQPRSEPIQSSIEEPKKNESADHREIAYLVAIPSENKRGEMLAHLIQQQSRVFQALAIASKQYTASHPTVAGLMNQLASLKERISELNADIVTYNIYLHAWTREIAQEIVQAELNSNSTAPNIQAVFLPQAHLELRGPRSSVEAFGDKVVGLLNSHSASSGDAPKRLLEILKRAEKDLGESPFRQTSPSQLDEIKLELLQRIAELEQQLASTEDSHSREAHDDHDSEEKNAASGNEGH